MKPSIRKLVEIVASQIKTQEPIVEIGSFQVPGQQHYADMRPLFPGKKYIGCDMRKGVGVDRVENIEHLSFKNNFAGTVLCLETLEHVWDQHRAAQELLRITQPGGLFVVSTVFAHPIHDHPSDYWRYTPESLKQLFKHATPRLVLWEGPPENPHTVYCLGFKNGTKEQSKILQKIAMIYHEYIANKPKEPLRLTVRKWRHEPMQQLRKLIAVKEVCEYELVAK